MLEERRLTSIRHSILSNFIKLTKYFTKGAYAELLNQQNVTLKFYTSSDEEKVLAEEADKLTTPSEGVSFKNIDPSLVFINEDEGSLSIISRTDSISQAEYKSLHQLFNSQNISNPPFYFCGGEYPGSVCCQRKSPYLDYTTGSLKMQ